MPGISGEGLAIILAAALTIYVGQGVVHGVKKIGHGIAHVAHKIVHPHQHGEDPPQ